MYEYNFKNDNIYADSVKIYIDNIFPCNNGPYELMERHPYYRLRGKHVTPEEAIKIIARTDRLFSSGYGFKDSVKCFFLHMDYFDTICKPHGWVHPNGIIGLNYSSDIKYPNIDEILEGLVPIADKFPYLDMIIAVSEWDVFSPARWDMWEENDDYKYYDDEDFTENLEMGIWVHNGVIEVVKPKLAAELYEEYDKLYDGIDRRIFFPYYYRDFAMDRIGRDFLRKCLNVYGIDDVDRFVKEVQQRGEAF